MRYEVSGIFCFDVEAESFEEAQELAWQELRQRGIRGCIIEVRKGGEECREKTKMPGRERSPGRYTKLG